MIITCHLNGESANGIEISLVRPGLKEQVLGQTHTDGRLKVETSEVEPADMMLFKAAHTAPAADTSYELVSYRTNLVYDTR